MAEARSTVSTCELCGAEIRVGDWPYCPHESTHRRAFTPFELEIDGVVERITSIQDADRIERRSFERYNSFDSAGKRLGSPSVLRQFHQDRSNWDKNTLEGLGQQPNKMRPFNSQGKPMRFGPTRPRE